VSAKQPSAPASDTRQLSRHSSAEEQSTETMKQSASTRQPLGPKLASVEEENDQVSSLGDTTPSFRPVTPQSFKPHPRHSSADVRSCKTTYTLTCSVISLLYYAALSREQPHSARRIVSASPYAY
jgi:hypothetical protein